MDNFSELPKEEQQPVDRHFIRVAKQALRESKSHDQIVKILRKEGLFDEDADKVIDQAWNEFSKEGDIKTEPQKKLGENQVFRWKILDFPLTVAAFLVYPFRIPPSRGLKFFTLFLLIIMVAWWAYSYSTGGGGISSDSIPGGGSEKELMNQLKTLQQYQNSY